jgi:chromosomal replication initiator protein
VNKSVDNVKFHNININKTWVDVLEFISPKVGDEAIDTWFQPLELENITEAQATIRVPNKFFGEWLGRNYKDLLIEAFQHAEKIKPADIVFVLKDQKNKDASQEVSFLKKETSLLPPSSKGRRQPLPNPKYTFSTFVVGASNQFAHAACLLLLNLQPKPITHYLFMGGSGLEKPTS